ncbi:MAG: D-aminoacyl-tRNA deacylase [Victivallaceae bacterium]|nr:D-aminoacyl-tRNA deacylase [Victivallaceae bacterium]
MRALIQRVSKASVEIDGKINGAIGCGMVILLGITHSDSLSDVEYVAEKCVNLRIYPDDNDKMNRSLLDVSGEVLIISQFTLYGSTVKGRRPGFAEAALPQHAIPLYEAFVKKISQTGVKKVATGKFGAKMSVNLENDGPVTLMVESKS